MTACQHCGRPCYLPDATDHPCCTYWAQQRPGRPCIACAASESASRDRRARERP